MTHRVAAAAAAISLIVALQPVAKDVLPAGPIRVIIPYGPGGATDLTARIMSDALADIVGRPIVIENRPGADGVIAIQELLRSKADGRTILLGNITTNLISPLVGTIRSPIDVLESVRPILRLVSIPSVLIATNVNFPPRTLAELIAYARANPGVVNHSTAGILAYSHIDWLLLQQRTQVELVAVPERSGAGGAQTDIINGDIQVALLNAATVLPVVRARKVKALAVTSAHRLPAYPDVPTFTELGFGGIGTSAWQAAFAPASTSPEVIGAFAAAFSEALMRKDVRQRFADLQFTIDPSTPANTMDWLTNERSRWAPIVADAKALYQRAAPRR